MAFATGLIVNRVHFDGLDGHSVEQVQALWHTALGDGLATRAAANLADFDVLVQRDRDTIAACRGSVVTGHGASWRTLPILADSPSSRITSSAELPRSACLEREGSPRPAPSSSATGSSDGSPPAAAGGLC